MLREKSCGIVPFRQVDGEIRYLVISSAVTKREHWEFPKGGVEKGEREVETALRELEEETGVSDVEILPGYREPIRYIYRRQEGLVFKQVIYFIGRVGDPTVNLRPEEVKDYRWATYDEARTLLRHGNARELLYRCHAFIQGKPIQSRGPIGRRAPREGEGARGAGGARRQQGRGQAARQGASLGGARIQPDRQTPGRPAASEEEGRRRQEPRQEAPQEAPQEARQEAPRERQQGRRQEVPQKGARPQDSQAGRAAPRIAAPGRETGPAQGSAPAQGEAPGRSRRRRRRRRPRGQAGGGSTGGEK